VGMFRHRLCHDTRLHKLRSSADNSDDLCNQIYLPYGATRATVGVPWIILPPTSIK
jgi:hypothetical protein